MYGIFFGHPVLWGISGVLTILMIIDCAIHRRDLYWFFILVCLGPIGAIAYMIYHWNSLSFPRFSFKSAMSPGGKTCTRCFRQVARLAPYQDGRTMHYLCAMCKGEMEILRADRLKAQ